MHIIGNYEIVKKDNNIYTYKHRSLNIIGNILILNSLTSTLSSSSSESICKPKANFCNFFFSSCKDASSSLNLKPFPLNPPLPVFIFLPL